MEVLQVLLEWLYLVEKRQNTTTDLSLQQTLPGQYWFVEMTIELTDIPKDAYQSLKIQSSSTVQICNCVLQLKHYNCTGITDRAEIVRAMKG